MKSSIRAIAMALLLSGAILPLCAQPSSDCSPIPEKIDSSQILNMMVQHRFYLDWKRSAQYQRDHALETFNWANFHADQKDSQALDPLSSVPPGADPFSAEKKDFGSYVFNRGPLDEAIFHGSDLTGTKFISTSLKNVSFDGWSRKDCGPPVQTILTGAEFRDADLSGASFAGADMTRVVFEPAQLPDADGIADAQKLELMTFAANPSPLLRLRQAFRDGGFGEQDRKIGYAIHRRWPNRSRKNAHRTSSAPASPLSVTALPIGLVSMDGTSGGQSRSALSPGSSSPLFSFSSCTIPAHPDSISLSRQASCSMRPPSKMLPRSGRFPLPTSCIQGRSATGRETKRAY